MPSDATNYELVQYHDLALIFLVTSLYYLASLAQSSLFSYLAK